MHSHFYIESLRIRDDLKVFFSKHKLPSFSERQFVDAMYYCRAAMSSYFWPRYDSRRDTIGKEAFLNLITHVITAPSDSALLESAVELLLKYQKPANQLMQYLQHEGAVTASERAIYDHVFLSVPLFQNSDFGQEFCLLLARRIKNVVSSKLFKDGSQFSLFAVGCNSYRSVKNFDARSYKLRFDDRIILEFKRTFSEALNGGVSREVVNIRFVNSELIKFEVSYQFDISGNITISMIITKSSTLINVGFRSSEDCVFVGLELD